MDEQLEVIRDNAERAGDLHKLIDQLEKATGPSRALDIDICDFIHGKQERWSGPTPEWARLYHARPTESIDAALTLVPLGYDYGLAHSKQHGLETWVQKPFKGGECFQGYAPEGTSGDATRAIALCIAALRARSQR